MDAGTLDPWIGGPVHPWPLCPWICGCTDAGIAVFLDTWTHGYTNAGLAIYMLSGLQDARMPGCCMLRLLYAWMLDA